MPQVSKVSERRKELLPIIARVFVEMGYRRATTAAVAKRCGVQENILYRLWPDKKAMFIAAIEHVYDCCVADWAALLGGGGRTPAARRLLKYEAQHHGQFGLYRIIFAGLSESDDPQIRGALRDMYRRFQGFLKQHIREHRDGERVDPDAESTAWAMIGLGTVFNVCRELNVLSAEARHRMFIKVGSLLLEGVVP